MKKEVSCSAVKRKDESNDFKDAKSNGVNIELEEDSSSNSDDDIIEDDYETECVKCKMLLENSTFTEVLCEFYGF